MSKHGEVIDNVCGQGAREFTNTPSVKLMLVGVSRNCFPIELAQKRLAALAGACQSGGQDLTVCDTIIENESHVSSALEQANVNGCNAAVVYLGNFGPEGPLSIFAQRFGGPVMICAAKEECGANLLQGRGDALCGMLNASISLGMRDVRAYIPPSPVGLADELVEEIAHFRDVARVVLGVRGLKIFSFGPRPHDFYACNAPIAQLYRMGIEVMENSELDLLHLYELVDDADPCVIAKAREMASELGEGNTYPDLLPRLARFEVAIERFAMDYLGSRRYAVFANKCWPAFEKAFGFVPCYVNSRLSSRQMPVACEVDLYGALSQYMCGLASVKPTTLLDINNSVPAEMIPPGTDLNGASPEELFMGFHCGNTPSGCVKNSAMKFQLIMNRLIEDPSTQPDITRGTLEGRLKPGNITLFRVQGMLNGEIASYVAQGRVLDIDPCSFGSIGIMAIPNFGRFYRHVLIGKTFPHHGAIAFSHVGRTLFDANAMLGIPDTSHPLPQGALYDAENPFA